MQNISTLSEAHFISYFTHMHITKSWTFDIVYCFRVFLKSALKIAFFKHKLLLKGNSRGTF